MKEGAKDAQFISLSKEMMKLQRNVNRIEVMTSYVMGCFKTRKRVIRVLRVNLAEYAFTLIGSRLFHPI